MYTVRTDLASERRELFGGTSFVKKGENGNVRTEEYEISADAEAEKLKLPKGRYISVLFDDPFLKADENDITEALKGSFDLLFGTFPENVLVLGLGNRAVTPDALGSFTCDRIRATRHLKIHPLFGFFSENGCRVSSLSVGVASNTGIESAETAQALVGQIKPDAVIVVDALAARSPEKLCKTVQLSNVGIVPASGYGGDRPAINRELLKIPVIGIGIPTVIDSRTYRTQFGTPVEDDGLILAPVDIARLVTRCSELLALGINGYLGTDF